MPNVDTQLQAALGLIALDFIFGVLVAFLHGTFRLSYVSQFLRDDVLSKLVPWVALRYVNKLVPGLAVVGVDVGTLATAAWVVFFAAMVGSILGSLKQLGISGLPETIAGADPATPMPPPPVGPPAP